MTDKDKKFEDLTADDCKDLKIVFAPGSFDNFEGTQEELDEFIAEITAMVQSGEILEKSRQLNVDDLSDEEAVSLAMALGIDLETGEQSEVKRNLQ
jgi:hypothetical protein